MDEKQLTDKLNDNLMEIVRMLSKSSTEASILYAHLVKWVCMVVMVLVITVGVCVAYNTHMTYNYDYQYNNTNSNVNENKNLNENDGGSD